MAIDHSGLHARPDARRGAASRRRVLGASLGAAGLAAIGGGLAGGLGRGVARAQGAPARGSEATQGPGPNPWREPPTLLSAGGVLEAVLDARPLAESGVGDMAYSGSIPGPTLRCRPGDTVRVRLDNHLSGRMTNLHVHGMHVSPGGNSDNVFVMVDDGESFQYEYTLPENHPCGVYWYHPHHHGDSSLQVGSGLAGAIVVEGGIDELPGIAGVPERLFVIAALQPSVGSADCTVNGVVNPLVAMRPGQVQRWRIANVSANAHLDLALDGHPLHVTGLDGNPLPAVVEHDHIVLGPGERVQALVQAGDPGTYRLLSRAWGEKGQAQPEMTVATVEIAGPAMDAPPLPTTLTDVPDLASADIAQRRTIVFQEGFHGLPFSIDGAQFAGDVVNTTVKLGTTEEWVLQNASDEWHPFHIHVDDFQVMAVNGEPFPYVNRQDTVALPPKGSVTVRIPFVDFPGTFVYHCHILSHEDFGMMAVIEVVP